MEYIEFTSKHDVGALEQNYLIGPIMGTEKNIFGLHGSMVRNSIELWANEEQKKHWLPKIDKETEDVKSKYRDSFSSKTIPFNASQKRPQHAGAAVPLKALGFDFIFFG